MDRPGMSTVTLTVQAGPGDAVGQLVPGASVVMVLAMRRLPGSGLRTVTVPVTVTTAHNRDVACPGDGGADDREGAGAGDLVTVGGGVVEDVTGIGHDRDARVGRRAGVGEGGGKCGSPPRGGGGDVGGVGDTQRGDEDGDGDGAGRIRTAARAVAAGGG